MLNTLLTGARFQIMLSKLSKLRAPGKSEVKADQDPSGNIFQIHL
jgi:hypothetical protein